jgi:hypothetical protein
MNTFQLISLDIYVEEVNGALDLNRAVRDQYFWYELEKSRQIL